MTDREYRQHPAVSRSELWKIRESPQKFRWAQEHPEEPTPALLFGQLFHKMLLEPSDLYKDFAVAPNVDRRTKAGKAEWADFVEQNGDKAIVTAEMISQALAMCSAVEAEPLAVKLLTGEHEKTFFWSDDLTGEPCKCRVDCLNTTYSQPIIVDVKTTTDASTDAFIRDTVKYGYDFQAAMYSEGVERNTGKKPLFVFVVVEKDPPHAVNILQADDLLLRRGYDLFREYIGIYHECRMSGNWYGYLGKLNQINTLALPAWLAKEVE